jgi:hypothetical protein
VFDPRIVAALNAKAFATAAVPRDVALFVPFRPHVIAEDFDGDETETLLNLWIALSPRHESAEATAFVAEAYERRPGRRPEPTP